MARVFIDGHMFGDEWFKTILPDLIDNDRVIFSYGKSAKLDGEHAKARAALSFYKLIGGLKTADGRKRRDDADAVELARHIELISSCDAYRSCAACDDAHIFAIIRLKPTPYVFSHDSRMAQCRGEIIKVVAREYCDFRVISSDQIYQQHKVRIHS